MTTYKETHLLQLKGIGSWKGRPGLSDKSSRAPEKVKSQAGEICYNQDRTLIETLLQ